MFGLKEVLCVTYECIAMLLAHSGARVMQAIVRKIHLLDIYVSICPPYSVLIKLYRIDVAIDQPRNLLKTVRIL